MLFAAGQRSCIVYFLGVNCCRGCLHTFVQRVQHFSSFALCCCWPQGMEAAQLLQQADAVSPASQIIVTETPQFCLLQAIKAKWFIFRGFNVAEVAFTHRL
jgi:hypothetical protein